MKEQDLDATAAAILAAIEPDLRAMVRNIVEEQLRDVFPQMLLETVARAAGEDRPIQAAQPAGAREGSEGTRGDSEVREVRHSADLEFDSRGRIVVTDAFLQRIAAEYIEAEEQGLHPNKALQERYDRSRSAVSHWLKQAREQDYLPKTED